MILNTWNPSRYNRITRLIFSAGFTFVDIELTALCKYWLDNHRNLIEISAAKQQLGSPACLFVFLSDNHDGDKESKG